MGNGLVFLSDESGGWLEGQSFVWGNGIAPVWANYAGIAGKTTPVGRYPPSGYGLYDMTGNALEWYMDENQEAFHAKSPKNNPIADSLILFV